MRREGFAYDVQTESGSLGGARFFAAGPVKFVEDFPLVPIVDTDPVVGHDPAGRIVEARERHDDLRILRTVFDRIFQKIVGHRGDARPVGENGGHFSVVAEVEGHLGVLVAQAVYDVLDEGTKIERLKIGLVGGFQTGTQQQIVDEIGEPFGFDESAGREGLRALEGNGPALEGL